MSFGGPYQNAGNLLNEQLQKKRGLKAIAFENHGKKKNSAPDKSTYATVCKTMQHVSTLNEILNANNKKLRQAIDFDSIRNKGLMYVLLYELLFGKYQSIRGGGKIKRMIVKHEKALRKEAEGYVSKHGGSGGTGVIFPRYLRVNTLHSSTADIVHKLKEDLSSKMDEANDDSGDDTKEKVQPEIYADAHVPDLLVLPPTVSSWLNHDYEPSKTGKIVLQDKSSNFSALVMVHGLSEDKANDGEKGEEGAFDYIDACAAPGNKTSHLAALVHSTLGDISTQPKKKKKGKVQKAKSTIFAFERSSTRYTILQERMNLLVPTNNGNKVAVEPIHGDFLKADPADPQFANVRAVMLDPSCSGSGIVNSPDRWMEEAGDGAKKDMKRIEALSNFQLVALKHSMSFPNVDRIVYSTCSVHDEENELVVSKALSEMEEIAVEEGEKWELAAPVCLEHWTRRGKEGGIGGLTKDQADCLIRCDGLDGDATNGFFVAFLVRKRLAEGLKKPRMVIDEASAGVPVYDGQFADMCKKVDAPTPTISTEKVDTKESSEGESPPATSQKKQQQQKTHTKKNDNEAVDKRMAKKIEKRLAWKRKQALQKGERLKKQKDAPKVSAGKVDAKGSTDDAAPAKSQKKKQQQKADTKKNDDDTVADKRTAKKREKKLAMKRKRALVKDQRLKKKEDAAKGAE